MGGYSTQCIHPLLLLLYLGTMIVRILYHEDYNHVSIRLKYDSAIAVGMVRARVGGSLHTESSQDRPIILSYMLMDVRADI